MDQQDKTWLWLVVTSFLAITLALVFAVVELNELREQVAGNVSF